MSASLAVLCTLVLLPLASLSAVRQSLEATVRGDARVTETKQMILRGALEGAVRGTLQVTVQWDGRPDVAGHWHLSFETHNADGSVTETGTVRGSLTGGTMLAGPGGLIVALSDVVLTVTAGSGEHAGVTGGGGKATLRFGRDNEPFTGDLALTF